MTPEVQTISGNQVKARYELDILRKSGVKSRSSAGSTVLPPYFVVT